MAWHGSIQAGMARIDTSRDGRAVRDDRITASRSKLLASTVKRKTSMYSGLSPSRVLLCCWWYYKKIWEEAGQEREEQPMRVLAWRCFMIRNHVLLASHRREQRMEQPAVSTFLPFSFAAVLCPHVDHPPPRTFAYRSNENPGSGKIFLLTLADIGLFRS